jgi:hypothetical protein
VPNWLVNIPTSNKGEIYSIGISDPEMDSASAINMAIYRAQIMANVFNNSITQLLCDFFMNESTNTSDIVYEHFSRINAKIPIDNTFEIIKTYTNDFDETMVLIKYHLIKRQKAKNQHRIIFELYKNEIESASFGEMESIYEISVKANSNTEPNPMLYQLTEFGKRSDVLSVTDDKEHSIPIYSLKYTGIPSTDSVEFCHFSHGLWKEYFKSVMIVILSKAREKPENIKYLSDTYNRNSLQKTTRGISINKMRFILTGITVSNNQINVNLHETTLTK